MAVRVSQVSLEILETTDPAVVVSQVSLEVLVSSVFATYDETGRSVEVRVTVTAQDRVIRPPHGWTWRAVAMPGQVGRKLQRSELSRMWLMKFRAGPGNAPALEGLWKAGSPDWPVGDATNIYVPDPSRYGQFVTVGKIIGERGNPTLPVTAIYEQDARSVLLQLAAGGCDHDLQVHMGECQDPRDFNRGWTKILVLEAARPTAWGANDLGALQTGDRALVNEEVPFTGERLYEVVRIILQEQAKSQVVQEVVDIVVCDAITCGTCGIPSDGCSTVFALTLSNGGSPGLPAEVVYTDDGGTTWNDTNINSLAASEDPNALACVGVYLVVVSEDSESLHYAEIAAILTGTDNWTEVTTGFVATKGPLAIFSTDPTHTWMVGEGGYVYFSEDPTAGVIVQDAGETTTQDLMAITGWDQLNLVAVGASNAVLVTENGGETWGAITGPDPGVTLNTVWMRSLTEWFIGTAGGKLWYTRDGGSTWTQKAFPGSGAGQIRDIQFSSATVGWMAHDTATPAGRILRTVDGGYSWYIAPEGNTNIPANDRINALAVCEDVNVVYGGGLADNAVDGFITKGA